MTEAPASTDALALQRTASDYDRTPYRSLAYPMSRPAHLAGIAHLLRLSVPDVATARVLEIGCASGGNIIPLAAAFPDGRFVGIDLSPVQIERAQQRAAAAKLGNIDFRCMSVTEIDRAFGTFDYIVCHGVYSWVPADVRKAILRVASERLSANGMAVVSYNVLPGWHLKRVARDVMLIHAGQFDDPAQKLAHSKAFLEYLKDRVPQNTPYGQVLRSEAEFLAVQGDEYVMHEFLETKNDPCTVLEFLNEAAGAGLAYLADAELHTMLPETHGAEIAAVLRQLSANRLVELEQYIDLLTGRTFRQSILMKPAAIAPAQRALDPSCMTGLHVSTRFAAVPDTRGAGPYVFTDSLGRSLTTASALVARALTALSAEWPSSATADALVDRVLAGAAPREVVQATVLDALLSLVNAGMASVSSTPVHVGSADASHPVAWPLARADAARGALETAGPQHVTVTLDLASRALLPLLDGTHDRAALTDAILGLVREGSVVLRLDDKPIEDAAILHSAAERMVDATLKALSSVGLLSR